MVLECSCTIRCTYNTTETSSYFMVFRASLEIFASFSASSSAAFNAVSVALKMMPLLDPRCTLIDWKQRPPRSKDWYTRKSSRNAFACCCRHWETSIVRRVSSTHHRDISCTYMSRCASAHMPNNRTSLVLPCVRCHNHTLLWNLLIMSSKGHNSYDDIKCHVNTKAKSNATLVIDFLDHWLWSCSFYQVFELI